MAKVTWAMRIFLLVHLVGLVACDGTIFKKAGSACWKESGICARTKWKWTGVIVPAHNGKPEQVEIMVLVDFTNTDPDPEWLKREDMFLELTARKEPSKRSKDEEENLKVYRNRAKMKCIPSKFVLSSLTFYDHDGLEIHHHDDLGYPSLDFPCLKPESKEDPKTVQLKFLIPKAYLTQIRTISITGGASTIWRNGIMRTEKKQ